MLAAPVLPKVEVDINAQQYGRYIIGPMESGYGVTLGNSLRRVLLSSLEGAAITTMRITDIPHEFAVVPGVREDVIQIMLQLKQLLLPEILLFFLQRTVKAEIFLCQCFE